MYRVSTSVQLCEWYYNPIPIHLTFYNILAQQQSLTQTLTLSLTQSQPQVQIQAQPTQQQTSQSAFNNAAGVVCSFRDCSSMKPCSVGTCNNVRLKLQSWRSQTIHN